MSETPLEATGIHAQYASQVAADLERNTKEQERIAAEVAALEEQLRVLRGDHDLLLSVQQALGVEESDAGAAPQTGEPEAAPATQVPNPRPASSERKRRGRKKETDGTSGASGTGKARGRRRAKKAPNTETAATGGAPTLVSLVRAYLDEVSEPRSAAEITADLAERHPDRTVKATVVRTTVEGLVAKGLAHRTKQGSSVFYLSAEDTAAGQPAEQAEPVAG